MRLPNIPSPQQGIDNMRQQIGNTKEVLQTKGFSQAGVQQMVKGGLPASAHDKLRLLNTAARNATKAVVSGVAAPVVAAGKFPACAVSAGVGAASSFAINCAKDYARTGRLRPSDAAGHAASGSAGLLRELTSR